MSRTNITTGLQTVTATGPVTPTGGLDVSGIQGEYTLKLRVTALSAAIGQPGARIVLEESVNAFAASMPLGVVDIVGSIGGSVDVLKEWRTYQVPLSVVGRASAVLRVNVVALQGSSPSVRLEAWLD